MTEQTTTQPDDTPDAAQDRPAPPPHWEADIVAADGGTVHMRPICPEDAEALVGLMDRSSDQTRYYRFFGPMKKLSDRDLHRFTHVDHVDRVAFVVLLGDQIIGVGRFDRYPGTDDAEIAFLVEDAHQGRGLGSVLLEHLAAAGRERGIKNFVAEVLAQNGKMVRVFQDAGYRAERSYEDGVVHLAFPIEQTEDALAVAYEREQRSESRSIARLLKPSSVAVVGTSNDDGKIGNALLRHLLDYGFAGPVYPVNPGARHVRGVPAYADIESIPDDVDLAVLAVPADEVAGVVEACRRKRVRGLVVVSGGFGETGPEGRAAERQLVAAARASGMRVVGPNCLGIVNTDSEVQLNASLAPMVPGRGRVGFFAQSGSLGVALLERARSRGIGLSSFVSAGNRADVSGNDLLQYWATDPGTEVVLLHLESFGNPRKFARLARRVARAKPVIAVKTGRYTSAAPLAATTSVPLPEERVQALFEGSGVIRVDTLTELFDVAQLLAYQPLPAGRTVAAVTNSSALGVLVVDACLGAGLELAGAPTDVGPDADPDAFATALRDATAGADAVVAVFVPALATSGDDYARALADVAAASTVPVVSTFLAAQGVPAPLRRVGPDGAVARGSVPSYPTPERAVRALAAAVRYADWRRRPQGTVPELPDVDPDAARALVAEVLRTVPDGRELTSAEAARLLGCYGISPEPQVVATGPEQAAEVATELGFPVALKATPEALRHRPDLGAVRLDLADAAAVRVAATALAAVDGDGTAPVLVQRMAPPGVATVVEVLDDPSFGALVAFGVGGVATDLLGDRAYAPVPLADTEAEALVRAPRAAPLLSGWRGAEPVDTEALRDLLLRVSQLAEALPEVLRLELNPVLVARAGLDVLSARVTVGPPTARVDPGPRRLR